MSVKEDMFELNEDNKIYVIKGKKYKRVLTKWRGYADSWHCTWDYILIDENES